MITHADSVLIAVNTVLNSEAQLELQSSIANLNTSPIFAQLVKLSILSITGWIIKSNN